MYLWLNTAFWRNHKTWLSRQPRSHGMTWYTTSLFWVDISTCRFQSVGNRRVPMEQPGPHSNCILREWYKERAWGKVKHGLWKGRAITAYKIGWQMLVPRKKEVAWQGKHFWWEWGAVLMEYIANRMRENASGALTANGKEEQCQWDIAKNWKGSNACGTLLVEKGSYTSRVLLSWGMCLFLSEAMSSQI